MDANANYLLHYSRIVRVVSVETGWSPKFGILYFNGKVGLGPTGQGFNKPQDVLNFCEENRTPLIWEGTTY